MYYIKYVLWSTNGVNVTSKLAVAFVKHKKICLKKCEAVSKKRGI
jgi:hypothetical protein